MEVIHCQNEIARGFEHQVYLSTDNEIIKAPTQMGKAWHCMDAGLADRDQFFLDNAAISHIPTTVRPGPFILETQDGIGREVDYVMSQPYLKGARTLDLATLIQYPDIRAAFMEMKIKAERLFQELQLGVDFLGGQAIIDLFKTLFKWRVNATIYNVLIPENDHHDREGVLIAQKNKPTLCDTRLYDCTGGAENLLAHVRRNIQLFQQEILDVFLRYIAKEKTPHKTEVNAFIHRMAAMGVLSFVGFRVAKK